MYRLIIIWMALLILLSVESCKPEPQPLTCNWDHEIEFVEAALFRLAWINKWEGLPDASGIPDSFLVSRELIDQMSNKYCGFRASYGLSKPNDIRSMGFMLTSINSDYQNPSPNQDSVVWVWEYDVDSHGNIPITKTSTESANQYAQNWQRYNGICRENDTLGNTNPHCKRTSMPGEIPPEGNVGSRITQIVPISQAYAFPNILTVVDSLYPDYVGLAFFNALIPTFMDTSILKSEARDSSILTTFRYDLIISALVMEDGKPSLKPLKPFTVGTSPPDEEYDFSCPCPSALPCCDPSY